MAKMAAVMMNEFPSAFRRSWYEMREAGGGQSGTVGFNGTGIPGTAGSRGYYPRAISPVSGQGAASTLAGRGHPVWARCRGGGNLGPKGAGSQLFYGRWILDQRPQLGLRVRQCLSPPGEVECQISSHHGKPIDPWGSDTPAPANSAIAML